MIADGRWDDMLNYVSIHRGDFFRIEPGTMHAILGGTLILETQQSFDVTYRVYDFDRVQDDGTTRELHIKESLDVVDYAQVPPHVRQNRGARGGRGDRAHGLSRLLR